MSSSKIPRTSYREYPGAAMVGQDPPARDSDRLRLHDRVTPTPGRNPGARARAGGRRPVLRRAHGRVRGRGDQDRDARPGRRPPAPRPVGGRLHVLVRRRQPEQEAHDPRPAHAEGTGHRSPAGAPVRRRSRELSARRPRALGYPDYMTGLFTAFGVMAALRHRDATGEGQWIDAALYESAFRVMEYTTTLYGRQRVVRERGGLQHSGWPGGAFQTQDGRWIVFTAPAQHLFERLCAMIGQRELPLDP